MVQPHGVLSFTGPEKIGSVFWLPEFAAKLNNRGCVGCIPVSVRHPYAGYCLDQIQAAFGKLQQSQGTQV
jgi:hypothetical protein